MSKKCTLGFILILSIVCLLSQSSFRSRLSPLGIGTGRFLRRRGPSGTDLAGVHRKYIPPISYMTLRQSHHLLLSKSYVTNSFFLICIFSWSKLMAMYFRVPKLATIVFQCVCACACVSVCVRMRVRVSNALCFLDPCDVCPPSMLSGRSCGRS